MRRAHAINSPIPPVNAAVQAAFRAGNPNTVWQYYKLIGVQATPVDGPPPATATADELSYYYMANIMVETNQVLQNFTGSVTASLSRRRLAKLLTSMSTAILRSPSRWAAAKVVTASRGNSPAGI